MRLHLASLVEDFVELGRETAVVRYRGSRRYATSYGDLALLAGRFAAELERRGLAPGDRVVVWGENSAEWMAAFFGCLLRAVMVVPLDAAGSTQFAQRVVADVAPRLVVGDRERLGLLDGGERLAFEEFSERLPAEPRMTVSEAVGEETPFQIVFTSGTTSEPKGVVHTHKNVLASLRPIEAEIGKYRRYERWVHPLRFLHTLPFSHVFGQFMGLWIPAILGAEVHLESRLDAGRLIGLAKREKISVLVAVPRVLEILRAHLLRTRPGLAGEMEAVAGQPVWKRWWRLRGVHREFGFKFWALVCGGATLPADLERFWNVLGFALVQGYGMTETAALVTLNHPFKIGKGTIGKALPGREVKLEGGEILVRGDMLAGATWEGGRLKSRESEWLATGDLAEQEASGELRFVGRKGDVIVTSAGLNVYPADLERAIAAQPGVRGCVVVACEGAQGNEPAAAVLFDGADDALAAAVRAANAGLAEFQQVRRFVRWAAPAFPYTSTGKLLRREVAAWTCARLAGAAAAGSSDPVLLAIAEVIREPVGNVGDEARLSDELRLDSLGRVQLQALLQERFGVELADDAVAGAETLGELRALVSRGFAEPTRDGEAVTPGVSADTAVSPTHADGKTVVMNGPPRVVDEPSYPRWPWNWAVRWVRVGFLEAIMRPLVWLLAAPKVTREAAVPGGPLLIVCNHVTTYDVPLLLHALPGRVRRRVAVAMAGELLQNLRRGREQGGWWMNLLGPVGYWLITGLFNVFPLPRLRGFRRSFNHAGEAMDRGYSVVVFPEGRRSWSETVGAFRPGIGMLAKETGATVLPVGLAGLGSAVKGGWFRSGKLAVRVGAPLRVEAGEDAAEITLRLESAVRGLVGLG